MPESTIARQPARRAVGLEGSLRGLTQHLPLRDLVLQGFIPHPAFEVAQKDVERPRHVSGRGRGVVGRHDHVGQVP